MNSQEQQLFDRGRLVQQMYWALQHPSQPFAEPTAPQDALSPSSESINVAPLHAVSVEKEFMLRQAEHQIRNPLALIGLYAENLRLSLPSGPLQEQAVMIAKAVAEVSQILAHLIQQETQSTHQRSFTDLQTILRESLVLLRPWLVNKQIEVNYPAQGIVALVDPWQIKQVFHNLLSNALHFSPVGSQIDCEWQHSAQGLRVSIRDRGCGLSSEDGQFMFQPLYSRRAGGTGIGLTIAQSIIEHHQGRIWAENHPDGGCAISFTLGGQL